MAVALLVPATAAASFTLGCAVIHAQRRHPERVTQVLLGVIALLLFAFVIHWTSDEAAIAESAADAGNPLIVFFE